MKKRIKSKLLPFLQGLQQIQSTFASGIKLCVKMAEKSIQSLKKISKNIRYIAVAEGISYLILLTLSILKRTSSIDVHLGIKYLGMVHGVLFVLFVAAIAAGVYFLKWGYLRALWAFVSSLLPFGTFYLDVQMLKEEKNMA